jgi:Kef-type K+ transport system membrane component KefB
MPEVSFDSLAVVIGVAFVIPLLLGLAPRVRVPSVVLEIVAGIIVGPQVLGWAEVDEPVSILALVGLAFLLFLAGLELDLDQLRGRLLRVAGLGFAISAGLALVVGVFLDATDQIHQPLLVAVILTSTSLGLVIPVLEEGGHLGTRLGQLTVAGASIGDFAAVILLSLLFSRDSTGTGTKAALLGAFAAAVALIAYLLTRRSRKMRLSSILERLQDTTAQIRVRGAMLLLLLMVVLAQHLGLETILGAFVAGAIVSVVDRDATRTHPQFKLKLEAIGYGFLIPVFFVTSGMRFDLNALLDNPTTLVKVPIFLLAMLVVRGLPAILYRPLVGSRGAIAAGLLQATSLPFIVAATQIGVAIHAIDAATAAAFVGAGLLSALFFPTIATGLLRRADPAMMAPADMVPADTTPAGADAGDRAGYGDGDDDQPDGGMAGTGAAPPRGQVAAPS